MPTGPLSQAGWNGVVLTSPQTSSAREACGRSPRILHETAVLPLVDLDERSCSAAGEVTEDQDVSVGVLAGEVARRATSTLLLKIQKPTNDLPCCCRARRRHTESRGRSPCS